MEYWVLENHTITPSFHHSIIPVFALSRPRTSPSLYRERYRSAVARRYPKQVFAFRFRLHINLALVHGIILHAVESVEQQIEHDLLGCTLSPCTAATRVEFNQDSQAVQNGVAMNQLYNLPDDACEVERREGELFFLH